jgi:hypothetical protein
MPKGKIPGGITPEHFMEIRRRLLAILDSSGAAVVNMRLNETDTAQFAPVFVGWVENKSLAEKRAALNIPDSGLFRFADAVRSKEYADTVLAKGRIVERDWNVQLTEKSGDQKKLLPVSGVTFQKFIALMVQQGDEQRCIGALNLGFIGKPNQAESDKAEKVMKDNATDSSTLIKFLRDNFELGMIGVDVRRRPS